MTLNPQAAVDFLPATYRQKQVRKVGGQRRLLVAVLMLALVGVLDLSQRSSRASLQGELLELEARYMQAEQVRAEWSRLQEQLKAAETEANLLAFLDYRWPTTQLVHLVGRELPREARLASLRWTVQPPPPPRLADSEHQQQPAAAATPVEQALATLLRERSGQKIVLVLQGHTREVGPLHAYVARLEQSPLVAKCQVQSLAVGERLGSVPEFSVHVTVAPLQESASPPNNSAVASRGGWEGAKK